MSEKSVPTIEQFARWVELGWTRKIGNEADDQREIAVMALGLAGETGEVIERIKKEIRGDGPLDVAKLKLELGDVLHYLCRIASRYGLSMNDVMLANVAKIEARIGSMRVARDTWPEEVGKWEQFARIEARLGKRAWETK